MLRYSKIYSGGWVAMGTLSLMFFVSTPSKSTYLHVETGEIDDCVRFCSTFGGPLRDRFEGSWTSLCGSGPS